MIRKSGSDLMGAVVRRVPNLMLFFCFDTSSLTDLRWALRSPIMLISDMNGVPGKRRRILSHSGARDGIETAYPEDMSI